MFFECEGYEINWDELFGFNNQLVHSAYNYTNEIRVVYIFDIDRSAIGLPMGKPYDYIREQSIPPFVRGVLPKVQHYETV